MGPPDPENNARRSAPPTPPPGWLGLNWAVVFILSGLAALGALGGLPLAIDIARTDPTVAAGLPQSPAAYYLLGLSMALQTLVLYGLFIVVGLTLGRRLGLGAPVLENLTRGRGVSGADRAMLLRAAMLGIAAGIAVVAIDWLVFLDRLPEALTKDVSSLAVRLLSGVLFGGFNEEIKWRLMTVTALVFIAAGAWRGVQGMPSRRAFATAILLAALAYAAFHLVNLAAVTELAPLVVSRTLILQTLLGVVFGVLYTRHGIEAAMLAHMGSQLPLQWATGY